MDLYFPEETRFKQFGGHPVSRYSTYERTWRDYGLLDVFPRLNLMARCSDESDPEGLPVEGPGVRLIRLPHYIGPLGYWRTRGRLRETIRKNCPPTAAYLLRVPSPVATLVWRELVRRRQPYALEVVGDPYDVLAPGGVKHPLRPVLRYMMFHTLKTQCKGAVAAAYVTKHALQKRYPCPGPTWAISNITLPDEAIVSAPRAWTSAQKEFTLVQVGHLSYLYKAPHIIIDALALCARQGTRARILFVGEGQRMEWLKQRARDRGIADRVEFTGGVPLGEPVRTLLDRADLFLLPSFQEGLPRAMVEAMARALPCIGSTVGGIPELLPAEDLVPPGDVGALARKIREVLADPERMTRMSARNLETARDYRAVILRGRRAELARCLLERTIAWQRERGIEVPSTREPRLVEPGAAAAAR